MDEVDERLVELLEHDGRATHRDLARAVGLSRSSVAARLRRLVGSGQVVVRGVVHPAVLGQDSLALVSLRVRGSAVAVAERVARRDDAPLVTLTAGRPAVVAELRVSSALAVDEAVGELRAIEGVDAIETLAYVEVVRDVVGPVGAVSHRTDPIDLSLLRALQDDGRSSYADLARLVGLSPAGARRRVVALLRERVVRVGALVRHSGADPASRLGIGMGVRLESGHEDVAAALVTLPHVTFVARTLGRFDLLLSMRGSGSAGLADAVDAVRRLPGVREVEAWAHLRIVKETYAQVGLGSGQS